VQHAPASRRTARRAGAQYRVRRHGWHSAQFDGSCGSRCRLGGRDSGCKMVSWFFSNAAAEGFSVCALFVSGVAYEAHNRSVARWEIQAVLRCLSRPMVEVATVARDWRIFEVRMLECTGRRGATSRARDCGVFLYLSHRLTYNRMQRARDA